MRATETTTTAYLPKTNQSGSRVRRPQLTWREANAVACEANRYTGDMLCRYRLGNSGIGGDDDDDNNNRRRPRFLASRRKLKLVRVICCCSVTIS